MKRFGFCVYVATAILSAASAHATAFTVTYTGTVSKDFTGSGLDGGSAVGASFTAVFTVDPATPGAIVTKQPNYVDIEGNYPFNPTSVSLTIGNQAIQIPTAPNLINPTLQDTLSSVDRQSIIGMGQTSNYISDAYNITSNYGGLSLNMSAENFDPQLPISPSVFGGSGTFDLSESNATGVYAVRSGYTNTAYLIFSPNKVTYSGVVNNAASAVPEPATWALMLLGFGMVGFAMRKRSNVRMSVSHT